MGSFARRAALLSVLLEIAPSVLFPQRPLTVLAANPDSTYVVVIGRDTLLAITMTMMKVDLGRKADLVAARAKLAIQDTTIARYADYRKHADSLLALDSAQIELQKAQMRDLRDEVSTLKELLRKANPLITLEGGAGITTKGLGVIGGVGIRRVRIWGTLQQEGSGVFAGLHLPIW